MSVNPVYQTAATQICSADFMGQLRQVRELQTFLLDEKVKLSAEDLPKIDLEELNSCSYNSKGRLPNMIEWRTLDSAFVTLASYLNDDMRRRIRIRELSIFFRTLPIIFLSTSIVIVIFDFMLEGGGLISYEHGAMRAFVWYIILMEWLVSQGGLGGCTFLAASLIVKRPSSSTSSVANNRPPSQIEFSDIDLTDRNFLNARILLGAAFGVVLGLPFAVKSLSTLAMGVVYRRDIASTDLGYILLPFLLGFSINLVLVALGRLVVAIETFFGVQKSG